MESFSFHFVFLGKAHQVSEVARKLASAQTRSESVKAREEILQRKSPLVGYNLNINNLIRVSEILQAETIICKLDIGNKVTSLQKWFNWKPGILKQTSFCKIIILQIINFDTSNVKTQSTRFKHPPTLQIFIDFRQNAFLTHPRRPYMAVFSNCALFICCLNGEIWESYRGPSINDRDYLDGWQTTYMDQRKK